VPDKLVMHLYDKHGFTWCGRLWQDQYKLPNAIVCQTCINRKENWERLMTSRDDDDEPK
jgi:hypothetical protein